MHVVEVKFHLFRRPLSRSCEVNGAVDHFDCLGFESRRIGSPLGGVMKHFVWGSNEDSVADFVTVGPLGCGGEFGVTTDLREKLGDGFSGFGGVGFHGFFNGEEVFGGPNVVNAGLS